MADSKQLAGLVGPVVLVLAVSEALNLHIWTQSLPPVVYLNGIILFAAGLALVRAHNVWSLSWTVLVTLAGWFALALGLFRILIPEAQQAGDGVVTYLGLAVFAVAGAVMTIQAYRS